MIHVKAEGKSSSYSFRQPMLPKIVLFSFFLHGSIIFPYYIRRQAGHRSSSGHAGDIPEEDVPYGRRPKHDMQHTFQAIHNSNKYSNFAGCRMVRPFNREQLLNSCSHFSFFLSSSGTLRRKEEDRNSDSMHEDSRCSPTAPNGTPPETNLLSG